MTNGERRLDPRVGLCSVCEHGRVVVSGKGSRFWMCELSLTDAGYRKYPPTPVRECGGFVVVRSDVSGRG